MSSLPLVATQANAALTQQLADSSQLLGALREDAAELAGQLAAAQGSIAAKDNLIEQLKALAGTGGDPAGRTGGAFERFQLQQSLKKLLQNEDLVCGSVASMALQE